MFDILESNFRLLSPIVWHFFQLAVKKLNKAYLSVMEVRCNPDWVSLGPAKLIGLLSQVGIDVMIALWSYGRAPPATIGHPGSPEQESLAKTSSNSRKCGCRSYCADLSRKPVQKACELMTRIVNFGKTISYWKKYWLFPQAVWELNLKIQYS